MGKIYTALGLMSGTSLDGIDFSIIQTDGKEYLSLSDNNYLEFSNTLRQKIRGIKSKITSTNECKEIIKSDEILKGILSKKETLEKINNLYNRVPEGFLVRNLLAIKKLLFYEKKEKIVKNKISKSRNINFASARNSKTWLTSNFSTNTYIWKTKLY